jgi:predicted amidohydrolase
VKKKQNGSGKEQQKLEKEDGDDEEEEEEVRLYNTAYIISPSGEILGSYRKKNIWHPERPHLTSSGEDPHEVFDTPVGKIGLLICWDLAFPEAFRELIAKGAEIIVIPTYCKSGRVKIPWKFVIFC